MANFISGKNNIWIVVTMVILILTVVFYQSSRTDQKGWQVGVTIYDLSFQPSPANITSQSKPSVAIQQTNPIDRFVYIKIGKTGSTTLFVMFNAYSYRNNIPVIATRTGGNGFHPGDMEPGGTWDIAPDRSRPPQISVDHARYSRIFFDKYFPDDTIYVTSIREPVNWFVSFINYEIAYHGLNKSNNPKLMLNDDNKFFNYLNTATSNGLSASWHNYFLMYLGFNVPRVYNETAVLHYIELIDKKFHLVMLTEYFDESLILLKTLMNWSMKDILYQKFNTATYRSEVLLNEADKIKLVDEDHNRGDLLLYQHFNRTLWRKISQHPNFYEELGIFREMRLRVQDFCQTQEKEEDGKEVLYLSNKWEQNIKFVGMDCGRQNRRKFVGEYASFYWDGRRKDYHSKRTIINPWPGLI